MAKQIKQADHQKKSKADARLNAVRKASNASKNDRVELLRRAGIVDSNGRLTKHYKSN